MRSLESRETPANILRYIYVYCMLYIRSSKAVVNTALLLLPTVDVTATSSTCCTSKCTSKCVAVAKCCTPNVHMCAFTVWWISSFPDGALFMETDGIFFYDNSSLHNIVASKRNGDVVKCVSWMGLEATGWNGSLAVILNLRSY